MWMDEPFLTDVIRTCFQRSDQKFLLPARKVRVSCCPLRKRIKHEVIDKWMRCDLLSYCVLVYFHWTACSIPTSRRSEENYKSLRMSSRQGMPFIHGYFTIHSLHTTSQNKHDLIISELKQRWPNCDEYYNTRLILDNDDISSPCDYVSDS